MEANIYCDNLEKDLTGWKSKIYDVIRIVDKLPDTEKETVFLSIRNLHLIVDEIDSQLEELRTSCPADWSPNQKTIDEKMNDLRSTLKALSDRVGGPLVPDSLSWVS